MYRYVEAPTFPMGRAEQRTTGGAGVTGRVLALSQKLTITYLNPPHENHQAVPELGG